MATAGCSAEIPLLVIADDDASTRISTQRLIRSFGFRTEVFTSAHEFLESGCVQEIACLILEFAAARHERSATTTSACVGLPSGSNHIRIRICKRPGQKRKPRRQGAVDFLRKPVAEQALVSAIRTALLCKAPRERYIGRTLNRVDELVRQNLAKAWTQNSIQNARIHKGTADYQ